MQNRLITPEHAHTGEIYADDNLVYSFKGRAIDIDKPISVYRNLHNGMYSVMQGNLVVAHAERICISSPRFIVREGGRQKVLRTKRKNVHAFVKGWYTGSACGTTANRNDLPMKIEYNPYKYDSFVCTNLINEPYKVEECRAAILDDKGIRGSN